MKSKEISQTYETSVMELIVQGAVPYRPRAWVFFIRF